MLVAGTVLIVGPDGEHRRTVSACAVQRGETPAYCASCEEARRLLAQGGFRVVFCHDELGDGRYVEVIRSAKPAPVIVLSRSAEWPRYLDALDAGAFDYIAYPLHGAEVDRVLLLALNEYSRAIGKRGAAA